MKRRNLKLSHVQKVEAMVYDDKVKIQVFARAGSVEWTCTGELDMYCATRLVRDVRKAMRRVRDEKTAILNGCVQEAEGPL